MSESVSRPAQRSLALQPADSPSRLMRPLYTGGSDGFVTSTAAPIVTGWSDPVPGRVFPPAVDQCLFTAHCKGLITAKIRGNSPWATDDEQGEVGSF